MGGGHLKVAFCADDVVRVAWSRDPAFFDRPSLAASVRRCHTPTVERADAGGKATLSTPKMKAQVDLRTGQIAFLDVREEGEVRNLGKPVDLARRYFEEGADEITFLNITGFRDFPLADLPMLPPVRPRQIIQAGDVFAGDGGARVGVHARAG